MTQRARLKKAGVGFAIQGRLARFLLRDRLSIFMGMSDGGRDLIESELPKLLGVPRVEVAISIGRGLRPNIKPVLQIMASDGRVLAFAKLAWNRLTSELVENEIMTLARLEEKVIRSFRVPRVLYRGEWNGFPLVLLSPLSHGLLRRWPLNALPPSTVLREVAGLGAESRGPLISGPYWREVSGRAQQVASYLGDGDRLEAAISELAGRVSTVEVIHCMSHGDFAPWNMMHAPDSINVWDWERASEIRPLGVDVLHFAFEVAYHKEGRDPFAAIDVALERSRSVLGELGVPRLTGEAIRDVYVLDRLTRLLEGRRAAVPVDDRLVESLAHSLIGRDDGSM
jgi:Phosphotransferase enzyme family.